MTDYAGAVYPCTVFESVDGEYAAVSKVCPSSLGSSMNSAEEAIDDLRVRIEADIRAIMEQGRTWFAKVGDRKMVPFPEEVTSEEQETEANEFVSHLKESGFEIRNMYTTTVKLRLLEL